MRACCRRRATLLVLLPLSLAAVTLHAGELEELAAAEVDSLVEIYRHLHAHPELPYQEKETSERIAEELRRLGFAVTERVGDYGVEGRSSYGVVGVLENGDGPTVMVRTDLDGLPVREQTGLPYASRVTMTDEGGTEVPVMHACVTTCT